MPPKRKRRASKESASVKKLRQSILTANDSSWGWVGTQVTQASDITVEHLWACCGLSKRYNHPFCRNHYSSPSHDNFLDVDASPTHRELDDIVIILDDESGPPCNPKTCRSNPNCLNYLGQEQWEDQDGSMKSFLKAVMLGKNPSTETRKPDLPTGLKNLGATCYANASLQVWFRDLAFRTGVYNCRPPFEMDPTFKESPIFQLQVTFAALEKSVQRAFNPIKLVESLQLNTTEQQDAQEFSKLFMSHLDAEFKKQTSPQVQSLIKDQFQGQLVYVTMCSHCQYRSEKVSDFLEIEINLVKKSFLQDRIAAVLQPETLSGDNQHCEHLRDATRYTELRELPPILHFSLLRFVYDISSMERKKSKHSITFPTTLDMSPFLGQANHCPAPGDTYELCGILLHIGSSAYHGHYEAQVYDNLNESWFQFNDETVTRVTALNGTKKETIVVDVDDFDEPFSISQGTKKEEAYPRNRRRSQSAGEEILQLQNVDEGPNSNKPISSKDAYMLVYTRKAFGKPQTSPQTTSEITASPPADAMKVVAELNDAHRGLCESFIEKEELLKNQFRKRRKKILDICSKWDVNSNDFAGSILVSRQALLAWLAQHKNEGASTIITIGEEKPVEKHIFMGEIVCPHGAIDPAKASNIKRISREAYLDIVKDTGWVFSPKLTAADICVPCVEQSFQERLYQIEHPRLVARFDHISDAAPGEEGFWISKTWLKDWKLTKPKMHTVPEGDPSPGSTEYLLDVLCEHDELTPNSISRLSISKEAAELLQDLFPSWKPVSTESKLCAICRVESRNIKKSARDSRKLAEDEKTRLKSLYDAAISRDPTDLIMSDSDVKHYALVPATFLEDWGRWIYQPTIWRRPAGINNHPFFCEHDMLVLDINFPEPGSSAVLISRSDWDVLETLYPSGPLVAVERLDQGAVRYTQGIPICVDCRSKRATNWTSTEITVHIDGARQRRAKFPIKDAFELPAGVRQSRRLKMRALGEKKSLTIFKSTTVKEVKIMLQDNAKIPTICQRLFHHGEELLDNNATAETLGISAHDILDLQQVYEINELDKSDSDEQEPRCEERGFGGTLLGGLTEISSASKSFSQTQKTCGACTFSNKPEALKCTICDTYFTE